MTSSFNLRFKRALSHSKRHAKKLNRGMVKGVTAFQINGTGKGWLVMGQLGPRRYRGCTLSQAKRWYQDDWVKHLEETFSYLST